MTHSSSTKTTQQSGSDAEIMACEYLLKNKLKLVLRNFRSRQGEIDLVMRDKEFLIFIEVRFRSNSTYGTAEESITTTKQKKIISTAKYYLSLHPHAHKLNIRFDVVAITQKNNNNSINWIKNAFQAF